MKKKEEQEWIRKVDAAITSGSHSKEIALRIEWAERFRDLGRSDAALEQYQQAFELARVFHDMNGDDAILAARNSAEINAEKGMTQKTFNFLADYERMVKHNKTEYQLMLTVAGWCCIRLYGNDENIDHIRKGLNYCTRSLEILETEPMDKQYINKSDSPSLREIHVHRHLADIHSCLGNRIEAERHSEKAMQVAVKEKLYNLQFEITRSRLDFKWRIDGSDKVKIAMELCTLANGSLRIMRLEAYSALAGVYFEQRMVAEGIKTLESVYDSTNYKSLREEDRQKYAGLMIFGYKARKALRSLRNAVQDEKELYRAHDALGDLFNEVGYKQAAFYHYKESLKSSNDKEEQRAALTSCALSALDTANFMESIGFFDRLKMLENEMGRDTSETQALIFKARVLKGMEESEMLIGIDGLEKSGGKFLDIAYNVVAFHYSKLGKEEEAHRFRSLEEHFLALNPRAEGDGEQEEDDCMLDNQILEMIRKEFDQAVRKLQLKKANGKENAYGESKLLELAREGKMEEIMFLVEQGANVNKPDPAGWTALSEAVTANNVSIVKYLLAKGANPNTSSKIGWAETNFSGGITPFMEACANGYVEIAKWMLQLSPGMVRLLVMSTNKDGWSAADFMFDYIARMQRGEESEDEFKKKRQDCQELLKRIQERQRMGGFPVRAGAPPSPVKKSDDAPRFAREKEATRRMARISGREGGEKKGATEDYKEAMKIVSSRSGKGEERKRRSREMEEEILDSEDDELQLFRTADKKVVVSCSDEGRICDRGSSRKRSSEADFDDSIMLGLDEENSGMLQNSSIVVRNQSKKLTGLQRLLKGGKRSVEKDHDNGILIVHDEEEIVMREEAGAIRSKRRRNESDGSLSEISCRQPVYPSSPRVSITGMIENSGGGVVEESLMFDPLSPSPVGLYRPPSRSSLSSASALMTIPLKITVIKPGEEEKTVRGVLPSDTMLYSIYSLLPMLNRFIDGGVCEWKMEGDDIEDMTLADLALFCDKKVVEVEVRVKKTMKGEFEKRVDVSDRDGPLSRALEAFEKDKRPSLKIDTGAKYSERSRDVLWELLREYCSEKRKEEEKGGDRWRVDTVQIDQWDVPSSALRTLIGLPMETLSLRFCEMTDEKMEAVVEELASVSDILALKSLDLSYNDDLTNCDLLVKMMQKMKSVTTVVMQGLSGIERGEQLMRQCADLPLHSLILDENSWLDDDCMGVFMREWKFGRLSTLKISKVAVRSLEWLEYDAEVLYNLKSLSLADNMNISIEGWKRVGVFISSSKGLRTLDLSGTQVPPSLMESLVARPLISPILTCTLLRCTRITPTEIFRILHSDVADSSQIHLKILLEASKVEKVRELTPTVAERVLKVAATQD